MNNYIMKYGFSQNELGIESHIPLSNENTAVVNSISTDKTNQVDLANSMLKNLPLTMAYVPMQKFTKKYSEEKALKAGTLFPDLDKPFLGKNM